MLQDRLECNICCYNGNHNNVGYTGSRAQTGVPGWGGQRGKARIINVTNRTVFVHSFTGSSTYTTIGDEDGIRTNECNDEHSWNGVRSFTL